MRTACTVGEVTCSTAIKTLLDLLGGRKGDACDIVSNIYEKDFTYKTYRGLRNQFLSASAYVLQLASIGMGIEAADLSIATNTPSQWSTAQSLYQL